MFPISEDYAVSIDSLFRFSHLPADLQEVSAPFHRLATDMDQKFPDGPMKDHFLLRLWEAKNVAVWMAAEQKAKAQKHPMAE